METTYEEFIQNILETRGRFACGDEYHERHHVLPKCMGGTNDDNNLIDLFAREHFEAHRLLALENSNNNELVYAWRCMAFLKNDFQQRYMLSPEEYEEIKSLLHRTLSNGNHPCAKPVIDLTTMQTYPTAGIAEKETGIDANAIRMCCLGQRKTAGGHIWMDYNDDIKEKINNNYSFPTLEEVREEKSKNIQKAQKLKFNDVNERIKLRDRIKKAYENPEYHQKQSVAKMGSKNPQSKMVICVETKHIYEAASTAWRKTGINKNCIGMCCRGLYNTAGGFQWKFIYDTKNKKGELIPGAITLGIVTEEQVNEWNNTK